MRDIRSIIPYVRHFGTWHRRPLSVVVLATCLLGACSSKVDEVAAAITPSPPPASSTTAGPPVSTLDPSIAIKTPPDHGEVGSPVSVTGTADVAGSEVSVRVLDANGSELAAADVEVDCRRACSGTFATELFFFVEEREPGWIEVSGETDRGRAVSTVPVILFPP